MRKLNSSVSSTLLAVLISICLAEIAVAIPNEKSNEANNELIQAYFGSVQAKIKANWKPPKNRTSASQLVRFKVLPDGQVTNVRTYRSANNPDMDSAGITAVKTASPFPKISVPPYDKDGLFMEMAFDYNVFHSKNPQVLQNNQLRSQARRSVEKGNWQGAVKILDSGLASDPNNAAFKSQLSEIYSNQANILAAKDPHSVKAIDLAKKAYSLDPSNDAAKMLIPVQWHIFSPPGYGFSVKFLNNPKHNNNWSLFGTLDSWIVDSDGCMYQVGAAKFNEITRLAVTTESGLEGAFRGFINEYFKNIKPKSGGEITSQKLIKEYNLNGHPAKAYTFCIRSANGRFVLYGESIFCITEHFAYVFTDLDRQSKVGSAIPFLNSIKITD